MILVLLGAPGAGKGTQAEALSAATGAAHVATGDLFRAEIAAGSPLGLAAQQFIDAGQLVPDEVTINMIQARLVKADAVNRVILDGFPRNPAQASALDAAYAASGRSIRAVLLKVDDAILAERLTARRVCPSCGRSYHLLSRPPQSPGVCDVCATTLVTRSDDAPETVAARLANQLAALGSVVELYRATGRLTEVSGVGTVDEVQGRLAAAAAAAGLTA
ncbi:MAG: nucleoside monophosphate kinase [Chloroflexi bacterium]|nr:nucleoside monophosphate kinase [Chloroflexota bacterium]